MADLRLNELLDFALRVREDLATLPLEFLLRPEVLDRLRAEGYSDEDIRRAMVPPVAEEFHED
jgi:hypothetical protein